jgi:hypothetical protein
MDNPATQSIFRSLVRSLSTKHPEAETWGQAGKPMSPGERMRDQVNRYYNRI